MTSFEIVKEYTLRSLVISEDAWLQRIESAERLEASSDFYLIEVAFARDCCSLCCFGSRRTPGFRRIFAEQAWQAP